MTPTATPPTPRSSSKGVYSIRRWGVEYLSTLAECNCNRVVDNHYEARAIPRASVFEMVFESESESITRAFASHDE